LFELTVENAPEYLTGRGLPAPISVKELGGGVSNTVLLVEGPGGERMVLKQSLAKLRVEQDWFADRSRIFRESAAMRALHPHLAPDGVPEVLFEDSANCLYAMSAAPDDARTWKEQLLSGQIDKGAAVRAGEMLASIIRASWRDSAWDAEFGDQTVFDQLRLDPYYRATAARHPDLAPQFERLIADCAARRLSLVHGDWSPKNLLVSGDLVMAIDFEVIHFGDPAFDAAFLLNHLALKSFLMPEHRLRLAGAAEVFWWALREGLPSGAEWMEPAAVRHLGALMLARVDGKSPVEYLRSDELRERVRQFARGVLLEPPETLAEVFERLP
jgi:5-methylthioribose kinase